MGQCTSCKMKKSVRDDTVVSNSNLKLDRFVMLMWSFASERNRTYEHVMRGACLASGEGYADNDMSKRTVARFFAYFWYIICKDFDKNANEKLEVKMMWCK